MATTSNPIQHIVVLMLENRSYDNMLGGLYLAGNPAPYNQAPAGQVGLQGLGPNPGAHTNPNPNGSDPVPAANQTKNTVAPDGSSYPATTIPIIDPGEEFGSMAYQYTGQFQLSNPYVNNGPPLTMQGFALNYNDQPGASPNYISQIMNYFTPNQAPVTAWLANNFAVCDCWYASVPTQTFSNRAFAHTAAPSIYKGVSLIDDIQYLDQTDTTLTMIPSIFSQLDAVMPATNAKAPYWKVYYHDYSISMLTVPYVMQQGLNPVNSQGQTIQNVNIATFDGTDWGEAPQTLSELSLSRPPYTTTPLANATTTFLEDIAQNTLPLYSFIEPRYANNVSPGSAKYPPNSNHPGMSNLYTDVPLPPLSSTNPPIDISAGEALLAQVYNLIYNSPYWDNTLLIVTYDEPGGLYDHMPPLAATAPGTTTSNPPITILAVSDAAPDFAADGFGFNVFGGRVPTLVIGKYIASGTRITPPAGQTFDHTSIIKTVWECFGLFSGPNGLPYLTQRDANAPSLLSLIPLLNPPINCPGSYPPASYGPPAGLNIVAYGEGIMYPPNLGPQIAAIQTAGWTSVILGLFHVNAAGDIYFNDTPIIKGGAYIGDQTWPDALGQLLAPGQSTITTLLASIGGGGVTDFAAIQTIYQNNKGTFAGTALEANFQTFAATFPMIRLIDMDVEDAYDQPSFVAFCQMLFRIRFGITFCPYEEMEFWTGSLSALNASNRGAVKGWNLQCYDGGAGNNPSEWAQAIETAIPGFNTNGFIVAGDWSRELAQPSGAPPHWQGDCPPAVQGLLYRFKGEPCVAGGFIWTIDEIVNYQANQKKLPDPQPCGNVGMPQYVQAIRAALTNTEAVNAQVAH